MDINKTTMSPHAIIPFVKVARAPDNTGLGEKWRMEQTHPTLNIFDNGDARCVCAVLHKNPVTMYGINPQGGGNESMLKRGRPDFGGVAYGRDFG